MVIVAETMLFTTLVGGYLVLRGAGGPWPPPGQPRLPIALTWVNTFVLLASCVMMYRAWSALRTGETGRLKSSLIGTALLGSTFLVIQGTEWARLVRFGMTMSASIYGATFYALIGLHGLHVLVAVVWLAYVSISRRSPGADLCAIYWFYVCGLWAFLFPLVYLIP